MPILQFMKDKTLLTRKQVADIYNVQPDTVSKWQHLKIITPYCRINGRPRYRLEDLANLLTTKTISDGK